MPNWCYNTLELNGSKEAIHVFRDGMKAFVMAQNVKPNDPPRHPDEFDFNYLIPMPSDIQNTTSPRPATEAEIRKMAEDYKWDEETLNWRLGTAITEEEKARYASLKESYGVETWYDWAIRNWGTKWNACDPVLIRDEPTSLLWRFETAWSYPDPIFAEIVEKFPNLKVLSAHEFEGEEGRVLHIDWNTSSVSEEVVEIED